MDTSKWKVGMMSGTSLDGIDVAAIRTDGVCVFEIGPGLCVPYPEAFKQEIRSILGSTEPSPKISKIEETVTWMHADAFEKFLEKFNFERGSIDLIGFHGHAIMHHPPSRFPGQARTWQIGDGALLARLTGIPVIANMRAEDVRAGGEGAPLIPFYHQALATDLEKPLAILNIGGISNVTWLGAQGEVLAFDMGPGNGLINDWMGKYARKDFDENGASAAQGKVHKERIEEFLKDPFFSRKPPKSLDRLDFSISLVEGLSLEDGAATLTEMTAAAVVEGASFFPERPIRWLLTGGGCHNGTLVRHLKEDLSPAIVEKVEDFGWSGDFLEAQAWGFLAVRSLKKLPLSLPTTTGVPYPVTGGEFFKPENFLS
jgi:anhydro-N-acetylmuramic acid kinase